MARIARVVVAGVPHHVTQRGNRREPVFFNADDYRLYRGLIAAAARRADVEIWAYCLMPNHVHLIVTPNDVDGLRNTFADAHRRYTCAINARSHWTGHLFQGRFGAVAMDEAHLLAAVRYVALNPVAAGLVRRAEDGPWSSARAHQAGRDDDLVAVAPVLERISDFAEFLAEEADEEVTARLERAQTIGRPVGSQEWVAALEAKLSRPLAPRKRGPKPGLQDSRLQNEIDLFSKPSP